MTQLNWRSFWFVLALGASLGIPQGLVADEPECDAQDPDKCSQPLEAGEPAAFAGQLLTPKLALTLGQAAESAGIRLKLETQRLTDLHAIELGYHRSIQDIERAASDKQIQLLTQRLKDEKKGLWYEHPVFVAAVACLGTIAVLYGSAYLLQTVN